MATRKQSLTPEQRDTLAAVHAYLDRQAVKAPGAPDTPALREAREMRTRLEEAFPDALTKAPPA